MKHFIVLLRLTQPHLAQFRLARSASWLELVAA